MTPRTRSKSQQSHSQLVRPSPEDAAEIRAGLAELDRGDGIQLTAEELRQWAETG